MKKEDKQRLTIELHQALVKKGFRYFMIEDVTMSKDGTTITSCTVSPIRDFPASFPKSCTGIHDGMITSLIDGHHITIYLQHDGELN